jgi:5-methylthioribose kinase
VSALDAAGVVAFLAARPELAVRVGPAGSEGSWSVKEVGDGNINFVYIVTVSCGDGSSSSCSAAECMQQLCQ